MMVPLNQQKFMYMQQRFPLAGFPQGPLHMLQDYLIYAMNSEGLQAATNAVDATELYRRLRGLVYG